MNAAYLISPEDTHFRINVPRLSVPTIRGMIERRILVNFRCDPEVLRKKLPAPFQLKRIRGWGMAGICLIRLREMRPSFLPVGCGLASENAAHRIAVEWNEGDTLQQGVFIPRRDTDSWLNRLAGGRMFPGVHHPAEFRVWETGGRCKLQMRSTDGESFVRLVARVTSALPAASVFQTLDEASDFFRAGSIGWSPRPCSRECDGVELRCNSWRMEPLAVERVESSYFSNADWFLPGSVVFDSAFLMREIEHEWHARGRYSPITG